MPTNNVNKNSKTNLVVSEHCQKQLLGNGKYMNARSYQLFVRIRFATIIEYVRTISRHCTNFVRMMLGHYINHARMISSHYTIEYVQQRVITVCQLYAYQIVAEIIMRTYYVDVLYLINRTAL